ncbi:DUF6886 family protein [Paenibacillus humicola]|uniref:DUF6886 family protein n=1 Tax=Paenibacillus humicola TaxID=3110540 RepID=UPI00237B3995|nr:DUF6886 family protein [Paenibacillus humicola]
MLYHFSENPGIDMFVPREQPARIGFPPVVWAIDDEHQITYYFPRNCPRIVYRRSAGISAGDERNFFGFTGAHTVVTVEAGWYEAIKGCTLYRYALPEAGFACFDRSAGYYISRETVRPVDVEPVNGLIERILETGAELRFTPDLHPLRNAILSSTVKDFGIYRFRFAKEPGEG